MSLAFLHISDESPDHGPEREDDLHSVVYTAFTFLMLTYAFDEFYSVTTVRQTS